MAYHKSRTRLGGKQPTKLLRGHDQKERNGKNSCFCRQAAKTEVFTPACLQRGNWRISSCSHCCMHEGAGRRPPSHQARHKTSQIFQNNSGVQPVTVVRFAEIYFSCGERTSMATKKSADGKTSGTSLMITEHAIMIALDAATKRKMARCMEKSGKVTFSVSEHVATKLPQLLDNGTKVD